MARGCVYYKPRADGSRSWHVRVDLPRTEGIPRKRYHRSGFPTQKSANAHLNTVLGQIEGEQFVEPSKMRLGEFMDFWLDAVAPNIRESTKAGFRSHIEVHVKPRIGAVPLQKVSPLLLDGFYRELLEHGRADGRGTALSPNTVRRIHATVRLALAYGVKKRLLLHNPAMDADPPRTRSTEISVWTPTELRTFLERTADHPLFPAFFLAAGTGMRRGEILGLRWSDVDLDEGTVYIRRALVSVRNVVQVSEPKTKSGKRQISVDPSVVEVLRSWRFQQRGGGLIPIEEWVFTTARGEPIHPDRFSKAFVSACEGAGVPRIRLHDLRHTHASIGLASGVPNKVMSERLGHSSVTFTQDRYVHVLEGMHREAANTIADFTREARW